MGIHSCSIWRCSNALYTSNMDMRCRIALNLPNFGPNLHRHICVRVRSHARQKHIQALKHFIYIQYGCEMQCGLVFIPQNMIPWCHSGSPLPPIFPIGSPPPQWCNCVMWCTHMPIHSMQRCRSTSSTSKIDVRCRVGWFTASKHDQIRSPYGIYVRHVCTNS